jgi:hypothetical protein
VASDQWAVVKRWLAATLVFVVSAPAIAQEVKEPWQTPCKNEIVRPNLDLEMRQHISGELKDRTGAPFQDSKVILRRLSDKGSFVDYRSVNTEKSGKFDLKLVDPGKYRFLPAPNRGFKQPNDVQCGDSGDCEIKLVLEISPTDQEFTGCPVR